MNFNIRFTTPNKNLFIAPPGKMGLDILDVIREDLAPINISADMIQEGYCPTSLSQKVSVIEYCLSEEEARASGQFSGQENICVTVPSYSLSKFVTQEFIPKYDTLYTLNEKWYDGILTFKKTKPKVESILTVYINYIIERDEIIKQWISNGAPLEWNPEQKFE